MGKSQQAILEFAGNFPRKEKCKIIPTNNFREGKGEVFIHESVRKNSVVILILFNP